MTKHPNYKNVPSSKTFHLQKVLSTKQNILGCKSPDYNKAFYMPNVANYQHSRIQNVPTAKGSNYKISQLQRPKL